MPFKSILLLTFLAACFFSCGDSTGAGNGFQSARVDGDISNADIIRNPIGLDGSVDTSMLAKLTFEAPVYQFGSIDQGGVITHDFQFTNTGSAPLLINDARVTCGCTVPSYPEYPIQPGESGTIQVQFDTQGKEGRQSKPITILANTYPNATEIRLVGVVEK
ncbi:MAG: DUF1573 domain-containing protein [Bacteroidota bacterium]